MIKLASGASSTAYSLASGLSSTKEHTLSIRKITEDNQQRNKKGQATFHGFSLPAGGSFGSAPSRPSRRLEFVGDSDTAGWCADGSSRTGDAPDKYEDSHQTWAQKIADSLGAEMMVEAISGYGVTSASTPIQPYAVRTNPFDSSKLWDFTTWTPDAILFLIGPNDVFYDESPSEFTSAKHVHARNESRYHSADERASAFVKGYLSLLKVYTDAYAHVAKKPVMVHVCGGSLNGLDSCSPTQNAIALFNAEHSDG